MELTLRTDRTLIRAGAHSVRYCEVIVAAPGAPRRAGRSPLNVALVLDSSVAMNGNGKFQLACETVEYALRLLHAEDRFTLVVYDADAEVLVPATLATRAAKRSALSRLREVDLRDGTNLQAGWEAAAGELGRVLTGLSMNRALLITSGHTDLDRQVTWELGAQAAELRRGGIATSTFSVGSDCDERWLRDIAHEGGGNCHAIHSSSQIASAIERELGERLEMASHDAALHIALPSGAEAMPLDWQQESVQEADGNLRIELGSLTYEQEISMLLRIRFATGTTNQLAQVRASVTETGSEGVRGSATLAWRYATHVANDAQTRDRAIDLRVATVHAARARAAAIDATRNGDVEAARRAMEGTAARVRRYASGDSALTALWRALLEESEQIAGHPLGAARVTPANNVVEGARRVSAAPGGSQESGSVSGTGG